jgi:plastocyanin
MSRPLLPLFALVLALAATRLAAGTVVVTVKDDKGQPVADTVVSLVPLDSAAAAVPPPAEPAVVSQQGEEFTPYVTAVAVGTRVSFPNHDKIHHQIYSESPAKPFAIPLHGPGAEQTLVFDQPGIVALGCNIHDAMSAYVVILATPHFLKTPSDGTARLANVPPGRYRLDVWHPRLKGDPRRDIVVTADTAATQSISVSLKPDKRLRRAPDGGGGGYK